MIARYVDPQRVAKRINIITDTTDFFRVDYDDVVILEGKPYLIRNYEREGRFTIDEQPKFWVKRAIDLTDGSRKIVKMVFHERFTAKVGNIRFECIRSPRKEGRVLALVKGHANFMQGFSTMDSAGNMIRIMDYIPGKSLDYLISGRGKDHKDYFYHHFPYVLDEFIELVRAIKFLHDHDEKHGDIRRDHIIKDDRSGICKWIDFDFNYWHKENMFGYDIFGLGNILAYITGGGDVTVQYLKHNNTTAYEKINADDLNIIFHNRVANLKKIYPYIPAELNFILLHFSEGADVFYDDTVQFLNDLQEVRQNFVCLKP